MACSLCAIYAQCESSFQRILWKKENYLNETRHNKNTIKMLSAIYPYFIDKIKFFLLFIVFSLAANYHESSFFKIYSIFYSACMKSIFGMD